MGLTGKQWLDGDAAKALPNGEREKFPRRVKRFEAKQKVYDARDQAVWEEQIAGKPNPDYEGNWFYRLFGSKPTEPKSPKFRGPLKAAYQAHKADVVKANGPAIYKQAGVGAVAGLLATGAEHAYSGGDPATGTNQNGTPGKQSNGTNIVQKPMKQVTRRKPKKEIPTTKKDLKNAKIGKKDDPQGSKGMPWWSILLIVFAILLAVGGGVYFFVFMPSEEDEVYDEMAEL